MIEDLTPGHHVKLECKDSQGKIRPKYNLQGDPRRRVIPRGLSGEIKIHMGADVTFYFEWARHRREEDDVRLWGDGLSELACKMHEVARKMKHRGRGRGLTRPSVPNLPATEYEKKTDYTPRQVDKDDRVRPLRKFHRYDEMEASKFRGVRRHMVKDELFRRSFIYKAKVYKAVDLATGDICTLKEFVVTQGMQEDTWKADLKAEVEKLLDLKHVRSLPDL